MDCTAGYIFECDGLTSLSAARLDAPLSTSLLNK
jgi:hypothetical protein